MCFEVFSQVIKRLINQPSGRFDIIGPHQAGDLFKRVPLIKQEVDGFFLPGGEFL